MFKSQNWRIGVPRINIWYNLLECILVFTCPTLDTASLFLSEVCLLNAISSPPFVSPLCLGQSYLAVLFPSWGEDGLNHACMEQTTHILIPLFCFDVSFFEHKQFLPIAAIFWIVRKYKVFVLLILWTLPDLLMHGICAFGSVISVYSLPIRKIKIKPSLTTGTELGQASK